MYILTVIVLIPMIRTIRFRTLINKVSGFWTIAGITAIGILTVPYIFIRLEDYQHYFSYGQRNVSLTDDYIFFAAGV